MTAVWTAAGVAWMVTLLLGLDAGDRTSGFYATELVLIAVHALVLFGLMGLWRAGLVGAKGWGRRGLGLAIAGRVAFLAFEMAAIAVGRDELPVFPIAVISTGVGMVVAAGAAQEPGSWRGLRRLAPLAMGAYPVILIVPIFAITGERPPNIVVAGWGLTFVGIAVAVGARSTSDGRRAAPDRAAPARWSNG